MFSIGGSARCSRRRCQGVARRSILPEVFFSSVMHSWSTSTSGRIAAAALAHGHAVAHGDVREVGVHGVALAVVAGSATVVFPARPGLGYGSGASRRGVRAREGSRRGRASVGRGRAFSPRGGAARTHQCDSVISSSAAASKMVGPFSSSTLMMSGAFVACGGSGELCAPVASGQPRDRETGVFSNFPEARPARSTAGR